MLLLSLILPIAAAAPLSTAWGNKPVLGVTLGHRWERLDTCGLDPARAAELRAVAEQVEAEAEALRREGDHIIREAAPAERVALLEAQDQAGAVARLSAWEASEAERLAGAEFPCLWAALEADWAEDRARALAGPTFLPSPTATTVSYTVFATQFAAHTDDEVAIPDYCIKFANLGWETCSAGYASPPYNVVIDHDGISREIYVGDVGPWNIDDNYWNSAGDPSRPRRMFTDLAQGSPESAAAYYDDYNGGLDQYGRAVSNPAGVDLAVDTATTLGLAYLENDWVTLTFPWEGSVIYPSLQISASGAAPAGQPVDSVPDGVADVWVGQEWVLSLLVKNAGTEAAGNPRLGLWAEAPYLAVAHWEVYSDYPYGDQATWSRSDANDHPSNPAADAPGSTFSLEINTLSPGETKLTVLTLRASEPSVGAVDHPDLRAWVSHVDGYYEKADFDTVPTNTGGYQTWNGGDLRAYVQHDVRSSETTWDFEDGSTAGWWAGGAAALTVGGGALSLSLAGADPSLTSPPLDVSAEDVATVQILARGDLSGEGRLYWTTAEAPDLSDERSLPFTLSASAAPVELRLSTVGLPGWTGALTRLRLDPLPEGSGTWVIDELSLLSEDGTPAEGGGGSDGGGGGLVGAPPGAATPWDEVSGKAGCSAAPTPRGGAAATWLLTVVWARALWRSRRHAAVPSGGDRAYNNGDAPPAPDAPC